MLLDIFQAAKQGNEELIKMYIILFLLSLPIIILSLSIHEVAHGFVAYKLGDPTARNLGRLTLNPLKHLDPIGFLCMVVFGFGFAKPVPIQSRNFKKPRRDMAISAAAGPISNIILAIIFAALLKILYVLPISVPYDNTVLVNILMYTALFLDMGIQLNVMLAVFNLLPCPPLDGSKILYIFLPPKVLYKVLDYERYIYWGLLLLLATGILSPVIGFLSGKVEWLIRLVFFL